MARTIISCFLLPLLAHTCLARQLLQGHQPVLGPFMSFPADLVGTSDAASAGAVTAQQATPAQFAALVDRHNYHRARHGAAPLAWDGALAAEAARWSAGCMWAHTNPPVLNGEFYGQNLAGLPTPSSIAATYCRAPWPPCADDTVGSQLWGTELWYDEVAVWDFDKSMPLYDDYRSNPDHQVGHFTQLVWKGSTRIGCAVSTCSPLTNSGISTAAHYLVCNYLPPGNIVDTRFATTAPEYWSWYNANVLPFREPTASPSPAPPRSPSPSPRSPSPSPVPIPSPSPSPVESPPPGGEVINDQNSLTAGEELRGARCLWSDSKEYKLCVSPYGDLMVSRDTTKFTGKESVWRSMMPMGPSALNPNSEAPYKLVMGQDSFAIMNKYGQEVTKVTATTAEFLPIKLVMRNNGKVGVFDAFNQCLFGFGPPVGTAGGC